LIIRGDVDCVPGLDGNIGIAHCVTSADLRALGVEGNGKRPACLVLLGLAGVINNRLVVVVRAVGEVHANDIEPSFAESVDLLGGVGLGANGADDGGAAVLLSRLVLGVQLGEPLDARAAGIEVVEGVGHGWVRGCMCVKEDGGAMEGSGEGGGGRSRGFGGSEGLLSNANGRKCC
jgi:hypothetical protein